MKDYGVPVTLRDPDGPGVPPANQHSNADPAFRSVVRPGAVVLIDVAVERFQAACRVRNHSPATRQIYFAVLGRFAREVQVYSPIALADINIGTIEGYLADLLTRMKPVSAHQHYRVLRTFLLWCVSTGLCVDTPMRGITMRTPKTLPRVPSDDEVRALLRACGEGWEGCRNKVLVALLADGGLRVSEALRLRLEDMDFTTRTLTVRGGKGGKDGLGFFGSETARLLQAWLAMRPGSDQADFLFATRDGRPLTRDYGTHLLHRLSKRAGLPRKIGPHALRHYAAMALLKNTGNLEVVRQVLRHETLAMTLRYARLAGLEVAQQFRQASPLDNLSGRSDTKRRPTKRGGL